MGFPARNASFWIILVGFGISGFKNSQSLNGCEVWFKEVGPLAARAEMLGSLRAVRSS